MGVGTSKANIEEWLEDIYYTYDKDKSNTIDSKEFRRFIDHCLTVANVECKYCEKDFQDLINSIDLTENGYVSRAEMRVWLNDLAYKSDLSESANEENREDFLKKEKIMQDAKD